MDGPMDHLRSEHIIEFFVGVEAKAQRMTPFPQNLQFQYRRHEPLEFGGQLAGPAQPQTPWC